LFTQRPLAPPYVPFGIRRFVRLLENNVDILMYPRFSRRVLDCTIQNRAIGYPPVAFSSVGKFPRLTFRDTQFLQVYVSGFDTSSRYMPLTFCAPAAIIDIG